MNHLLNTSSWKRCNFGDLVSNVNEYFDPMADGVLPYVAGPHIVSGQASVASYGSTDDALFPPTFKRKFQPHDVLLHSRGIGKLASVDRAGVTGEKLFVLRSKNENHLLQSFLIWLLQSPQAQGHMRDNFTGSVNKFLNWKPLAEMKVDLPPLDQQKRIADMLWAVDRHEQSLSTFVTSVSTAADDYFSIAVSAREIPMRPVSQLVDELTVGVVVRPTQYYTDDPSGVPALRGLNVRPGGFDLTDIVRFRRESAAELVKSTLRAGEVVVVRTGRPGDAAVVTEDIAGFNCIDLIIARPSTRLAPEYFALYLNSGYGRAQITRLSAGTAQQHFNVGALKKLQIPDLDLDRQLSIVNNVTTIMNGARAGREEAAALRTTRSSLLTSVFGGN